MVVINSAEPIWVNLTLWHGPTNAILRYDTYHRACQNQFSDGDIAGTVNRLSIWVTNIRSIYERIKNLLIWHLFLYSKE